MKPKMPEKHLSVKQAREILASYGKSEFYRKLDTGEIRARYEMRGNRRHWSIPISAINEFIERLRTNQPEIGSGLEPLLHPEKTSIGAAPQSCLPGQQAQQRGAASYHKPLGTSSLDEPLSEDRGETPSSQLSAAPRLIQGREE